MDTETITLKEGDVYSWTYADRLDTGAWGTYHCCSRIAIVGANGRLRDTFWSSSNDGKSFGVDDLPNLHLTFLANMADLKKANEHEARYYDDADIVNLNHSNSSRDNFYLRNGAKRSQAKMLESAHRMLKEAESSARMAVQRANELRVAIVRIETGEITDVYL